jgi:hypothetical protein
MIIVQLNIIYIITDFVIGYFIFYKWSQRTEDVWHCGLVLEGRKYVKDQNISLIFW